MKNITSIISKTKDISYDHVKQLLAAITISVFTISIFHITERISIHFELGLRLIEIIVVTLVLGIIMAKLSYSIFFKRAEGNWLLSNMKSKGKVLLSKIFTPGFLVSVVIMLLAAISSITTYRGLHEANRMHTDIMDRELVPLFATLGVFLAVITAENILLYYASVVTKLKGFGKNLKAFIILWVIAVPSVIVGVFFSSTTWSIIGLGGVPAYSAYMSSAINDINEKFNDLVDLVSVEKHFSPQLNFLSNELSKLSIMESELGAVSKLKGRGAVTLQLQSLSQSVNNIKKMVDGVIDQKEKLISEAREEIQAMRHEISTADSSGGGVYLRSVNFNARLSNINEKFAGIKQFPTEGIRQIAANLEQISSVVTKDDIYLMKGQKSALIALQTNTKATKQLINDFINSRKESKNDLMDNQLKFKTISEVIWTNKRSIVPAISMSLVLDFLPFVFILMMNLISTFKKETEEALVRKLEEKQKTVTQS